MQVLSYRFQLTNYISKAIYEYSKKTFVKKYNHNLKHNNRLIIFSPMLPLISPHGFQIVIKIHMILVIKVNPVPFYHSQWIIHTCRSIYKCWVKKYMKIFYCFLFYPLICYLQEPIGPKILMVLVLRVNLYIILPLPIVCSRLQADW